MAHKTKKTEEKRENRKIGSPGKVWQSTIIDQIELPSVGYRYAIHEQMPDKSWRTREDISFPDPHAKGILVPMKEPLWPLPSRPIEYDSEKELFKDIHEFLHQHLELRDKRCYDVMGNYVL